MNFKQTSFIFISVLPLPKARTLDFHKSKNLFLIAHRELLGTGTVYFQTQVDLKSSSPSIQPNPGGTAFLRERLICTRLVRPLSVVCSE